MRFTLNLTTTTGRRLGLDPQAICPVVIGRARRKAWRAGAEKRLVAERARKPN